MSSLGSSSQRSAQENTLRRICYAISSNRAEVMRGLQTVVAAKSAYLAPENEEHNKDEDDFEQTAKTVYLSRYEFRSAVQWGACGVEHEEVGTLMQYLNPDPHQPLSLARLWALVDNFIRSGKLPAPSPQRARPHNSRVVQAEREHVGRPANPVDKLLQMLGDVPTTSDHKSHSAQDKFPQTSLHRTHVRPKAGFLAPHSPDHSRGRSKSPPLRSTSQHSHSSKLALCPTPNTTESLTPSFWQTSAHRWRNDSSTPTAMQPSSFNAQTSQIGVEDFSSTFGNKFKSSDFAERPSGKMTSFGGQTSVPRTITRPLYGSHLGTNVERGLLDSTTRNFPESSLKRSSDRDEGDIGRGYNDRVNGSVAKWESSGERVRQGAKLRERQQACAEETIEWPRKAASGRDTSTSGNMDMRRCQILEEEADALRAELEYERSVRKQVEDELEDFKQSMFENRSSKRDDFLPHDSQVVAELRAEMASLKDALSAAEEQSARDVAAVREREEQLRWRERRLLNALLKTLQVTKSQYPSLDHYSHQLDKVYGSLDHMFQQVMGQNEESRENWRGLPKFDSVLGSQDELKAEARNETPSHKNMSIKVARNSHEFSSDQSSEQRNSTLIDELTELRHEIQGFMGCELEN